MQIVCPSCGSSYSLSAEQLGTGRTLRCAKCRHTWFATAGQDAETGDAVEAAIDPVAAVPGGAAAEDVPSAGAAPAGMIPPDSADAGPVPRGSAMRARPAAGPKRRLKLPRMTAVHAAAAALLLLALVGTQRQTVVRLFPQTAPLYAAIGLPVNLRGLEFAGLRSELVIDKDQAVLIVEGEIKGVAQGMTAVPKVTVSLRGAEGREIYAWTSDVQRGALGKGERTAFRARLVSPPAEGRDVFVRFADRDSRPTPTP